MSIEEARQRLYEAARGYFGSKEATEKWLDTPHRGLAGKRPKDLLSTTEEVEQISEIISQLEHGDSA